MSKTNHRVNKDRGEKLGESVSHRHRRDFKIKANDLIEVYEDLEDLELDDDDFERYEKIKRKK